MSEVTYTAIANDGFTYVFRFSENEASWRDESGEWVSSIDAQEASSAWEAAQLILDDIDSLGGTDPSYVVSVIRNEGGKSNVTN